jgi:hypothetical protein
VCDLETSRMGAPYVYDISRLRVKCILARQLILRERKRKNRTNYVMSNFTIHIFHFVTLGWLNQVD